MVRRKKIDRALRVFPYRPRFVQYDLEFLKDAVTKTSNKMSLPAKFDRRHQDYAKKRHWEYLRWQRLNHPPPPQPLNRYAISHGFIYFHPLLYNGWFSKNKNLTKTWIPYGPKKRRFRQIHASRYQEQR